MNEELQYGTIVKWKLFVALTIGLTLIALFVLTYKSTSTAFGLPIGGMGEFTVVFDRLEGTGFFIHTTVDQQSNADEIPLVRNEIKDATVYGLHIYKDLHVPMVGWIRVNVESSEPTEIKGLIQEARFIEADINFANLGMSNQEVTTLLLQGPFHIQDGDIVSITDAKIITDYLFQNTVSLDGMTVTIEKNRPID